jgi:hypothetical protein
MFDMITGRSLTGGFENRKLVRQPRWKLTSRRLWRPRERSTDEGLRL